VRLKGKVRTGIGDLSTKMVLPNVEAIYIQKTGMKLFPGSLNVQLQNDFHVLPKIRIEGHEYGGTVCVSLMPCKMFNRKAFIVRTDKVAAQKSDQNIHPLSVIEIVTDVKLREIYNLKDGDEVEIEI
jgi:riboflavin kinase